MYCCAGTTSLPVLRSCLIVSEATEGCESEHYMASSEGKETDSPLQCTQVTIEEVIAPIGARFSILLESVFAPRRRQTATGASNPQGVTVTESGVVIGTRLPPAKSDAGDRVATGIGMVCV